MVTRRKTTKTTRRTRPVTQQEAEPEDQSVTEGIGPVQEVGEEPDTLFDEMGDDSYILISRTHPVTKAQEFLGRLSPAEANLETIAEKCGGGTYRLKEKRRDETGAFVYSRQRTVQVGGAVKPSEAINLGAVTVPQKPGTSEVATATPASLDQELKSAFTASVLSMLKQGQEMTTAQIEALRGLMSSQQDRQPDPMLQMLMEQNRATQEQNTAILTALLTRESASNAADPLAVVKEISAVFRENLGKPGDMEGQISTLMSLWDLKDRMNPTPETPTDPVTGLVSKFGTALDIMKNEQEARKAQAARAGVPTAAALPMGPTEITAAPPDQPQPTDNVAMRVWEQVVKNRAPYYIQLATHGKDPEDCADAEFNVNMPDWAKGTVRELLSQDDPVGQVLAVEPRLQPWRNWVEQFLVRLHQNFHPELYPEDGSEELEPEGEVIANEPEAPFPAPPASAMGVEEAEVVEVMEGDSPPMGA